MSKAPNKMKLRPSPSLSDALILSLSVWPLLTVYSTLASDYKPLFCSQSVFPWAPGEGSTVDSGSTAVALPRLLLLSGLWCAGMLAFSALVVNYSMSSSLSSKDCCLHDNLTPCLALLILRAQ